MPSSSPASRNARRSRRLQPRSNARSFSATLKAALADRAWLAQHGVRVCLQGHLAIQVAARAVHDTMKALRDGIAPAAIQGLPPDDFMKRITRDAQHKSWTKDFLGG